MAESARHDKAGSSALNPLLLCLMSGIGMAFGWQYRGVVGHESGGMVAGAILGMVLCLGSGRPDWHRRSMVAALFGAVGFAWGGSLTFMEYTLYVSSYSFPTVLFGYAGIFFIGVLWCGLGCGTIGIALTLPRTRLESLARAFATVCAFYFAAYLAFAFRPDWQAAYAVYTQEHWHDGEWLAALLGLIASGVHWIARPKDRAAAGFLFLSAVAWWTGYLVLTKFGGLALVPPYRSESWGGVLGMYAALLIYLHRDKNRAALAMSAYGAVIGGLAYATAMLLRHPIHVSWGPFAGTGEFFRGKTFEMSFGFLFGMGIAMVVTGMLRRGLKPAEEDCERRPLDVFSAFSVLVVLSWINLKNAPIAWIHRYKVAPQEPVLGVMPWVWYLVGGLLIAGVAVHALYLYYRDELPVVPSSAYGKGALALILLLWVNWISAFVTRFTDAKSDQRLVINFLFVFFISTVTWLLLVHYSRARRARVSTGSTPYTDSQWRLGKAFLVLCLASPAVVFASTGLSMAMQTGPHPMSRLRFGPNAYWRVQTQLVGSWKASGFVSSVEGQESQGDPPIAALDIRDDLTLVVSFPDGTVNDVDHGWIRSNPYPSIVWWKDEVSNPEHGKMRMRLHGGNLYVPWPPQGPQEFYVVFDRAAGTATPSIGSGEG
ncbi:MAG: hypothetical protein AMXMBFR84_25240 [Candidatus Hydrogenedentota bacterium]